VHVANSHVFRLLISAAGLVTVPTAVIGAEFNCVIEPRQVLELRSPIEGLIERVNVDRGDYVKKGQALAVLDTSVDRVQAAIASHRSQMDGAVLSWQSRGELSSKKSSRMDELHRQNYLSAQARDEAATEKRVSEAELRDALDNRKLAELEHKRQLEIIRLKTIRSPVNGVITERVLNPGELAEAGVGRKPMLKLAEIDTLHVEVILPVAAYGKVKLGSAIRVMPDVPAGSQHRATVKVVDKVMDAASGTFGVRLELSNAERKIPSGIRCRAIFPDIDESLAVKGRSPVQAQRPASEGNSKR
jgi:RND family efflux transporter MFP subunit